MKNTLITMLTLAKFFLKEIEQTADSEQLTAYSEQHGRRTERFVHERKTQNAESRALPIERVQS